MAESTREAHLSKGTLIGEGRIAEIYAWGDNQVLKLFHEWCAPDWVDHEAGIARTVHAAGVASPAVGEVVPCNGRDHNEFKPHAPGGSGNARRLVNIYRSGSSVLNRAETAVAGAGGAKDHEGGRRLAEALCPVRAACLLAYRQDTALAKKRPDPARLGKGEPGPYPLWQP